MKRKLVALIMLVALVACEGGGETEDVRQSVSTCKVNCELGFEGLPSRIDKCIEECEEVKE